MSSATVHPPTPAAGQPVSTMNLLHTTTILIVDDSSLDRRVAACIVEKHPGWKTVVAKNGVEALALIERAPPRAVLTDMQMPEMDGLELVEQIRQRFPHIPVVLMTGIGQRKDRHRGVAAWCLQLRPQA